MNYLVPSVWRAKRAKFFKFGKIIPEINSKKSNLEKGEKSISPKGVNRPQIELLDRVLEPLLSTIAYA